MERGQCESPFLQVTKKAGKTFETRSSAGQEVAMNSKVTGNPSFRKALRKAYLSRAKAGVRDDWPLKVMRRVREIGPVTIPGFWHDFEQVVWRLAPASGILVFALALLFLNMDS